VVMTVVNVVVGVLLLIDLVVVFKLYENGWPKRITAANVGPGTVSVKVAPIPFSILDWWILAAFIGLQLLLIYLAWRLRAGRRRAATLSRGTS